MDKISNSCLVSLILILGLLFLIFAIDAIIAIILLWLYNMLAVYFGWITLNFWQMFIICIIIHFIKKLI